MLEANLEKHAGKTLYGTVVAPTVDVAIHAESRELMATVVDWRGSKVKYGLVFRSGMLPKRSINVSQQDRVSREGAVKEKWPREPSCFRAFRHSPMTVVSMTKQVNNQVIKPS